MSGHSKWHQIKHKKEATDQKRGRLFSKILKAISIAARDNPNPDFNPRLRTAVEKAKGANVPNENIDRAIKKSSEEKNLEEVLVEAYGPEKSALIVEAITDNKNRTIAEVRNILNDHDAKIAEQGSVLWSFEKNSGGWQPKFIQPLSPEASKKLNSLLAALEEQDDVQKIITNAETHE